MQAEEIEALKDRYRRCDFSDSGAAEVGALSEAMEDLTVWQRVVWEMRFCGITREESDGVWGECYGPRLTCEQVARRHGCDKTLIRDTTKRTARKLLRRLA